MTGIRRGKGKTGPSRAVAENPWSWFTGKNMKYRDEDITALDAAILLDAVLHKPDLAGYALILLAGVSECEHE